MVYSLPPLKRGQLKIYPNGLCNQLTINSKPFQILTPMTIKGGTKIHGGTKIPESKGGQSPPFAPLPPPPLPPK